MEVKIENLKKVHLSLSLLDEERNTLGNGSHPFNFIYGCASTGLNPFEIELAERAEGDELFVKMSSSQMPGKLGHLFQPIRHALKLQILPQELHLQVTIDKVEKASEREIIQAMAVSLSSSCGGSCDCGCC